MPIPDRDPAHADWPILALILMNRAGGKVTIHADEIAAARTQLDVVQSETHLIAYHGSIFQPELLTVELHARPRGVEEAIDTFLDDVLGGDTDG